MAIAFDAVNSKSNAGVASDSFSHTCTGSNLMLICGVGALDGTLGNRTVSTITYNSVALTKINHADNGTNLRAELWYLIAPATGANTLSLTMGGSVGFLRFGCVSLTGVNQVAPEANNTATGNSTTPSVSVTTVTDNAWVIDIVMGTGAGNTLTVDASQTERWNQNGAGVGAPAASSTEPKVTAGAVSMDWTLGSSGGWGIVGASFAPAATGWGALLSGKRNRLVYT